MDQTKAAFSRVLSEQGYSLHQEMMAPNLIPVA
jgi:hypothetical protein